MSAYEMNKMMDQRGVRGWARISSPSVYRNLVQLYKQGYVESTTVKDSAMPERYGLLHYSRRQGASS